MSQNKHKHCLILNADYSPLSIVDYRKAIIFLYRDDILNSIEVMHYHKDDYIQGVNYTVQIPSIIRIKQYLSVYTWKVKFSRNNLFLRDNYKCQYCGKHMEKNALTYDHIIPKSQYRPKDGATTWTNIVSACISCNRKKANKTPEQANMKLMTSPIQPMKQKKYLSVHRTLSTINMPMEWIDYIR